MAPKVFISYSHDSPEHDDRVLAFANRLRHDGIDARIDRYNPAPSEGWRHWMEEEIRAADFVLLVFSEPYLPRLVGCEQPGKDQGVVGESNFLYKLLFENDPRGRRSRLIPVLFSELQPESIPLPMLVLVCYRVDTEPGYSDLLRSLTNHRGTPLPSVLRTPIPKSFDFTDISHSEDAVDFRQTFDIVRWPGGASISTEQEAADQDAQAAADALGLEQEFQSGVHTCCQIVECAGEQLRRGLRRHLTAVSRTGTLRSRSKRTKWNRYWFEFALADRKSLGSETLRISAN